MRRISLVICTYKRPALLAKLLDSVLALEGRDRARLDVVVVDNSDSGGARPTVDAVAARTDLPLLYVQAHPPNISIARNAGVAATESEIVAFLDDDQELAPGWLTAVLAGLDRFPHDVLFGPITPSFEEGAVVTPQARAMFTRAHSGEAGSDLLAFGGRGPRFALSTANSILRRASALPGATPFDPAFGQCGGEDFHLFCRLQRGGARFGWLPGAEAGDFIPRHRCEPAYLEQRHFAGAQAYAAALIRTSPRPRRAAAMIAARAVAQALLMPFAVAAALATRSPAGANLAIRLAGVRGKLFWRRLYPLYREEERRYGDEGGGPTSEARLSEVATP